MHCEDIDVEAIADGSAAATAAQLEHLRSCAGCRDRLELARSIESLLANREMAGPPAAFTAQVMGRVGAVRWQTERIVDFSFNVALGLGLLVIAISAAGLAWSVGLFSINIDRETIDLALGPLADERIGARVQTTIVAAVLLVMTLGLWWWAESDSAA